MPSEETDVPPAAQPAGRRIALVVNDLQPYGAQRVAVALAAAFVELDCVVDLVTLESPDRDGLELPDGVRRHGVQRHRRGALGYASLAGQLRPVLRSIEPDLVSSHMIFSNVTTLAAVRLLSGRARPPVVVTEHGLPRGLVVERSPRALAQLARRLYPQARRVVGVSDAVCAEVAQAYSLDPQLMCRIYNPVDVAAIRARPAVPPPHPWLAPGERDRTVVCVAGLRPAKGQDVLVAALAEAPGLRAILVGDGSTRPAIEQAVRDHGLGERVDLVGYRSDALEFIGSAAALVVPSRFEGFGLVAVEAAALGVPVIASSVGGLTELVPASVPGVVVPAEDASALAQALSSIPRQPRRTAPDLGDFDPRAVALRYLDAGRPDA